MLPDVNISERDQLIPLSIRQRYRCRAPIREHARDLFDILCVVPAARNRLAVCNRCRGSGKDSTASRTVRNSIRWCAQNWHSTTSARADDRSMCTGHTRGTYL